MLNPRRHQRGLSLVELMVGITIGMFVVAATTLLASSQLGNNRRLITETQLQQDLRATADIITRDIRRAGSVGVDSNGAAVQVWTPATEAQPNGLTPLTISASSIEFQVQRTFGSAGPYGYKLEDGVIKTQLADAGWQALTDANVVNVTKFEVTPVDEADVVIPCPKPCPVATPNCWPVLKVRSVLVEIEASAVGDTSVKRKVRSVAHLSNDQVNFNMAPSSSACPA